MQKARRELVKVSVSEILGQLLGESYAPREIVEENRLIHYRLGLEGDQEYSVVIGGLSSLMSHEHRSNSLDTSFTYGPICLVFKPDAVRDGVVYELKVLRRYSDRDRLILHGFLQLQLELYALGLEHGRLLVYRYDDGKIEEYSVMLDHGLVEKVIGWWIQSFKVKNDLVRFLTENLKSLVKQM